MPVSYTLLEAALQLVPPQQRRHFADIGCGKGRALAVAAQNGSERVTGIDFSPEFCAAASRNLEAVRTRRPALRYTIQLQDAASWPIPPDADCLFLFNPFDEHIMQQVVEQLQTSLARHPRTLHIIYVNPLQASLFLQAGFRIFRQLQTGKFRELMILTN